MTQANSPDASMILEADLCDRVVLRLLSNRLPLMNRHHYILTRPLCWPWSPTTDVLDRVRNCQCGLSADVQWVQRSDHGSVTHRHHASWRPCLMSTVKRKPGSRL